MSDISFPIAFVAGFVSFFAPCVVPLLPAYVAFVAGVSLDNLKKYGVVSYQKKLIISSLFYILGFSIIFVMLGTAAAGIGNLLRQYSFVLQRLGGILIVIFGLEAGGFVHIPFLGLSRRLITPLWLQKFGHLRSFFIGILFALVWTPCVGVILGSILTLAAISGEVGRGAALLLVYSFGISIPFLVVALTLAQAPGYINWFSDHVGTISKVAGVLLVTVGMLLLTDTYKYLNGWIFEVAFGLGYKIR